MSHAVHATGKASIGRVVGGDIRKRNSPLMQWSATGASEQLQFREVSESKVRPSRQ